MLLLPMPHKSLIERVLVQHRARKSGFHVAVWELIRHDAEADGLDYPWFRRTFDFIPDAFRIDPIGQRIAIFEVEVTSRLIWRKLNMIGSCAVHLAIFDWRLTLVRVDEHGRYRKEPLEPVIAAGWRQAKAAQAA